MQINVITLKGSWLANVVLNYSLFKLMILISFSNCQMKPILLNIGLMNQQASASMQEFPKFKVFYMHNPNLA